MISDASLALAAAASTLAATGIAAALSGAGGAAARRHLAALFLLIGLLPMPLLVARFWPAGLHVCIPLVLPLLLAIPPALSLYVREMTGAHQRPYGARDIWLFAPALAGLCVAAGVWFLPVGAARAMLIDGTLVPGAYAAALALFAFVLIIGWPILAIWHFVRMSADFARYRAHLRDHYANIEGLELRWLAWFTWVVAGQWSLFATSLLADNLIGRAILTMESALVLVVLLLAFLTLWALRSAPVADVAQPDDRPVPEKYARSVLTDDQAQRIADKIRGAMERDALYLDPALSLQKLSRHLGVSANLVSRVLNERIGETFFDHVNRWRVEAAIPAIAANQRSVLEVALSVGFNTRSTFYKAFRAVTGHTPNDYRHRAAAPSRAD